MNGNLILNLQKKHGQCRASKMLKTPNIAKYLEHVNKYHYDFLNTESR